MSWDISTIDANGVEDNELNITYNLSGMLAEAGFEGWASLAGRPAHEVAVEMLDLLNDMALEPQRWRAMNPPNGWGDYDRCLQGRVRDWANAVITKAPNDTVQVV